MSKESCGAKTAEWNLFAYSLNLKEDLIPIVSNKTIPISPNSNIDAEDIGKIPSVINSQGYITGLRGWVNLKARDEDIKSWMSNENYGFGINCRKVHAFDIDVDDKNQIAEIRKFISDALGCSPPYRYRANSCRILIPFYCEDGKKKSSFLTRHGKIELLRNDRQFAAAGRHPSGARYEWEFESEFDFPTLESQKLELLWVSLHEKFGTDPIVNTDNREKPSGNPDPSDPIAYFLGSHKNFLSAESDKINIACPFESEHTGKNKGSSTSYLIRTDQDPQSGRFRCLHEHCATRTNAEFMQALGYKEDVFAAVGLGPVAEAEGGDENDLLWKRYIPLSLPQFLIQRPPEWLIEDILPRAEIGAIFGESGAGKSFLAIDIAMAVARGCDWNCHKTPSGGKVVYIAAEGSSGMRSRLKAYLKDRKLDGEEDVEKLPFEVIDAAPNLYDKSETLALTKALKLAGKIDLIVIDTLAQVMPGANENASEDMSRIIAHCRGIHIATGAMVVLIHHAGKDTTRGLRGWSGLKAALDVSIEVTRQGQRRMVYLDKVKDGEDGLAWNFSLRALSLGVGINGKELFSCVADFDKAKANAAGRHGDAPRKKSYDNREKWRNVVMRVLTDTSAMSDPDEAPSVAFDDLVRLSAVEISGNDKPEKHYLQKARRVILALEKLDAVCISDGKVFVG